MTCPPTVKLANAEGVVRWFDPMKGFGFIAGPDGHDVFVHYTRIEGRGYRVLQDGAHVLYDAERGDRGWHATRVVRSESLAVTGAKRLYARTPRREHRQGA